MSNPLPPLVPDNFSGRRLGKYESVCRLSTGGMSVIFLAFTRGVSGFRKYVVLKQILPDVKGEDEFVRMFLDEAKITAAFNHPHIAQVFDLDVAEGELFLTMEFVPGATLVEVARACRAAREPIPVGLSIQSVRDTALALHYAHTFTDPFGQPQPVIHRDIAEKNIMVTYEGVTKLLDFGIAKSLKGQSRTSVGMVKGTSGYMSPEQIRGEKLDARTDIFSLGVVLHELLTGVRLFAARSTEEALVAPLQQVVEPPSRQNPEVPPELDAVVMRCLERDRAARFGTALELARELERSVRPGTLWHPEEAAAFMQRIFTERREQTRALLSSSAAPSPSEMHAALPSASQHKAAVEQTAPVPLEARPAEPDASGYDDDELPEDASSAAQGNSSEGSITSDVTGPTLPPRSAPGIVKRRTPARPVARTASPSAARPDSAPATIPASSPVPAKRQAVEEAPKSNTALYAGLGFVVLLAFGAAGWLIFSKPSSAPEQQRLQAALRPEVKAVASTGRVLVPPEPPALPRPAPEPTPVATPELQPTVPAIAPVVDAGSPAPVVVAPQPPPARVTPPPTPVPAPTPAVPAPQPVVAKPRPKRPEATPTVTSPAGDGAGFLTLVTEPAELTVMLGSRLLGETPLVKIPLPEGTHKLKLVGGDGQAINFSVSIKDGEVTALRKTLSGGE